jgi:hypothetical protein
MVNERVPQGCISSPSWRGRTYISRCMPMWQRYERRKVVLKRLGTCPCDEGKRRKVVLWRLGTCPCDEVKRRKVVLRRLRTCPCDEGKRYGRLFLDVLVHVLVAKVRYVPRWTTLFLDVLVHVLVTKVRDMEGCSWTSWYMSLWRR